MYVRINPILSRFFVTHFWILFRKLDLIHSVLNYLLETHYYQLNYYGNQSERDTIRFVM